MSAKWWINNVLLDVAAGEDLAISFRTQATSQASFSVAEAFDSSLAYAYRQLITIKRGETLGSATQFFRGKIDITNRVGGVQHESHDYHVTDPWQDLEDTIYQESWGLGAGAIFLPEAALGVSAAGVAITIGEQIAAVVTYAASVGVDIAVGTMEPGVILWPMNVENASCAEVIRTSLKFFPDYTPWINHSTSPPELNVTKSADLEARSIDLSGAGDADQIRVSKREDLQPDSVRLLYRTANESDGQVYRAIQEDLWPASGPTGGPRVLMASLNLAGMSAAYRKTPIEVLVMPTDAASAKSYLKEKFPVIAGVDLTHFTVTTWVKTVVTPSSEESDRHDLTTINPNATRLQGTILAHLPNDLLRGTIDDSMRVRVGRVHVAMTVAPTGGATSEEIAALAKLPAGFTVTATNATTKVYVSCEQYQSGEDAPTGIAQAVYTSMAAAYVWEGEISLVEQEAGAVRYHGACVNVTGTADSALATMQAMVHSADIDVASGKTVIGFGPAPHLAPADMIELQRQLRSRPATWWTTDERASNRLGNAAAPSSHGDSVAPYDMPMLLPDSAPGGAGGELLGSFCRQYVIGEGEAGEGDTYLQGGTITGSNGGSADIADRKTLDASTGVGSLAGDKLYLSCNVTATLANGIVQPGVELNSATLTTTLPTAHTFSTTALTGVVFVEIGRWTDTEFLPSGACGLSTVSGCPGGFAIN